MMLSIFFVVLGFVSVIKSEHCLRQKEQSLISSIRSTLKTLEEDLAGKYAECQTGWKEYKNHCYYFSSDTKTWHEAEKICRNMGGYLVQITDSSENSWVVTILTKAVQHQFGYWMGATNVKEGLWKWINDLSKVQYSNWNPGQPDNYGDEEDCASFWKDIKYNWNDAPSNYSGIGYICEKTRA
ncbi:perlucin-like protein [Mytilus californianus]|uniref:perlucin-like protein n=1 Tax=Mytilus californianus TaxID=6549 RepID=UPI0022483375|nr:perlucin-like protein [Mytilus californianus]